MTPESLTSRLHDIEELDPVSIWPLATGWWLVIASIVVLLVLVIALRRWQPNWQRYLPRYGWSRDAARELTELREQIGHADVKALTDQFSELLRRIAIARCGRDHCAGLHGERWLSWLSAHDPNGFDWRERGRVLLELPYAPPDAAQRRPELNDLIDAALTWTLYPRACRSRAEAADGV